MTNNGIRNIKHINEAVQFFSDNNMLGTYEKEEWEQFIKTVPARIMGKYLKNTDSDVYSLKQSIRLELARVRGQEFITEKEYNALLKELENESFSGLNGFECSNINQKPKKETPVEVVEKEVSTDEYSEYVPVKNNAFIEVGQIFSDIDNVISNKMFFPMYIYGISGIGKTFNVEQSCAKNSRPYFRVQITKDTTNEDLIGSYALINGNTIWRDGPVLKAYRSGGVLLLDEVDLNPSLMILQGVLENKPLYVTQTGELVYPSKGFQVFATGNSKGDGNDYEYVGTSALNKAFLERFDWIIEQKMPTIAIEKRILKKYISINNIEISDELLEFFLKWIDTVRKSYQNGDTSIYISTRRVQSIIKGYTLTKNIESAITNAMSHYDPEETKAFINVWKAINGSEN